MFPVALADLGVGPMDTVAVSGTPSLVTTVTKLLVLLQGGAKLYGPTGSSVVTL